MKTVLTAFMMLSAVSGGVPQRTPPALPLRAIYILHLGESDKPLWPFVLALEEPQPSDVARILQEPFWRHADIFVVPARMLEDVARIVRDDRAEDQSNDPMPHTFGSFQMTLVTAQTHNRVVMAPDQSKQFFRDLLIQIDPSQATLRSYVRNLLLRLGVQTLDGD